MQPLLYVGLFLLITAQPVRSGCDQTECVEKADGRDYDGKWSRTQRGRTCQSWSSQSPHKHRFTSLPNNYCRNPDGEPGAWCYTTDPQKRWELCGLPICECVKAADGIDYNGRRDKTQSGRTCQPWFSQFPHKHKFTSLPNNYCRNPDGEPGAWCYTTDPQKRWELCGVPICECVKTADGRDYDGKRDKTQSGRTCQSWSSQYPHKHKFTSLPKNYCRNPDGEPGAWCYTTDPKKRWELCGVPKCDCVKTPDGRDYKGTLNRTRSGRTCQSWSSQSPHTHKFNSLPNNYCRNPDGEPGIWCYTTDPKKRWELCGVSKCDDI